jgi:two-component system, cell cycle sensor histidine kinase and response regulator CckA
MSISSNIEIKTNPHPRILLLDDEEIIRENMEEIGDALNIEIICTKNSAEAIEKFKVEMNASRKFDAVILDLSIRGGPGGCETLKKIRLIDPEIKAILFSGEELSATNLSQRNCGFDALISKPVNIDDLASIVNEVLQIK